jgi:hypothetical protein
MGTRYKIPFGVIPMRQTTAQVGMTNCGGG